MSASAREKLYVVGAGGFGREVWAYAKDQNHYETVGFVDDNPDALKGFDCSGKVLCALDDFRPTPQDRIVIAIGDPAVRGRLAQRFTADGMASIIHPTAYVAGSAKVAPGCIVGPFAFVGPDSQLSPNVVLNTYASVGHDGVVGECSVLSPYAVINGNVTLGREVFLGTHATVTPGKTVGDSSKVGAGAVVLRDVESHALAIGNPARSRVLFAPSGASR